MTGSNNDNNNRRTIETANRNKAKKKDLEAAKIQEERRKLVQTYATRQAHWYYMVAFIGFKLDEMKFMVGTLMSTNAKEIDEVLDFAEMCLDNNEAPFNLGQQPPSFESADPMAIEAALDFYYALMHKKRKARERKRKKMRREVSNLSEQKKLEKKKLMREEEKRRNFSSVENLDVKYLDDQTMMDYHQSLLSLKEAENQLFGHIFRHASEENHDALLEISFDYAKRLRFLRRYLDMAKAAYGMERATGEELAKWNFDAKPEIDFNGSMVAEAIELAEKQINPHRVLLEEEESQDAAEAETKEDDFTGATDADGSTVK